MKTIEVKACDGRSVPTPNGTIGPNKYIKVQNTLFIRRRLAEGDLKEKPRTDKKKSSKRRKK